MPQFADGVGGRAQSLVHLYGHRPPEDTHNLEALHRALPRDIARSADRLLEKIDKPTMSRWRVVGTCPADYPALLAEAPTLAEPYVCAAVGLNRYPADHIKARIGARPELDRPRSCLERISASLDDDRELRTGPTPLTTVQDLAQSQSRYRQQDLPEDLPRQ